MTRFNTSTISAEESDTPQVGTGIRQRKRTQHGCDDSPEHASLWDPIRQRNSPSESACRRLPYVADGDAAIRPPQSDRVRFR